MLNLSKEYAKHFLEPFRHFNHPFYRERFISRLRTFQDKTITPRDFFKNADNRYFFWLMTFSGATGYDTGRLIPEMPSFYIQRSWTGSTGESTMLEAFSFFNQIVFWAKIYGNKPLDKMDLLDFGCGWGRIIRFFLRDIAHERLHGRDCWREAIDICRATNKWCDFQVSPVSPPMDFHDSSIDLT